MKRTALLTMMTILSMATIATPQGASGGGAHDAAAAALPQPPVAKKLPKTVTYQPNDPIVDDYFWLREKTNPDVVSYLEAENAYTDAMTKGQEPFRDALYKEMLSHIKETDIGVPYRKGDYFYYSRTEQGKQYGIQCRKKGSLDAPEQVILDVNELAKGEKFMSLGTMEVSDDGNLLAYSTDNSGYRQYRLQFKDLRNGQVFPEKMEKAHAVAWAADNKTIFYTVEEDPSKRPYRLYRHTLGTDSTQDQLIYEEKDEMFAISVDRSRSGDFIFLNIGSHTQSEVRYLSAKTPAGEWKIIEPRKTMHEYHADHRGDQFYIRTNDKGRNFRLVSAPVANPGQSKWKEIVAHRPDVMIAGMLVFAKYYALVERENGLPQIRVTDFSTGQSHRIEFPEPAYNAGPGPNEVFDASALRYSYQSLVTPNSVFDYDMAKRASTLLKQTEVPGGFDRANYQSERIYATAADGVKVPVSVVYRKGTKRDGKSPMLLTGYGAYGIPSNPGFSASRLALLDRGVVFAIAHIRGGGELGKPWHDAGRMMQKKNTFTDFISAGEYLVAQKYTASDRLVITGGSAGGLLMGAVTNMRPDLFKAVIAYVPFVDVVNTMSDASLPLTAGEWEEWGDPRKAEDYAYMRSYDPYLNVAAKNYPAMLVRTSFNDSQVSYHEPSKYVARMRALRTDKNPLLFKVIMRAGHGGASGRYDALRETAFDYAWMLSQLGIEK